MFSKMNIQSSSSKFSSLFRGNLDFKHSLDAEMSLEEKETKRFKDWPIQKVHFYKMNYCRIKVSEEQRVSLNHEIRHL